MRGVNVMIGILKRLFHTSTKEEIDALYNRDTGYCDKCGMKLKPKASPLVYRTTFGHPKMPPNEYVEEYNNYIPPCGRCGYDQKEEKYARKT